MQNTNEVHSEKEWPSLSYLEFKLLKIFLTIYLCEKTFLSMSVIKTPNGSDCSALSVRVNAKAILIKYSRKEAAAELKTKTYGIL